MRLLVEWGETFPSSQVFGVPLAEAFANSETPDTPGPFVVPSPLAKCIDWIENKSPFSHLYPVSILLMFHFSENVTEDAWMNAAKQTATLNEWKYKFNSGVIGAELPADLEASVVVGLLKLWIAELPGGLFGKVQHDALVRACVGLRGVALVTRLKDMIWEMKELLREVTRTLVFVLQETCRLNDKTFDAVSLGSVRSWRNLKGKNFESI